MTEPGSKSTNMDHILPAIFLSQGNELPSLSNAIPEVLERIRQHLDMEVAFVSEFREGERVFRHVKHDPTQEPIIRPGDKGPLEESYCQRVVDGRLPEIITDAQKLPAALELPVTKALPVGAHMSVAIQLSDGRVYGTFCCFSCRPDPSLDQRDLAMMRVFADFVAKLIEQDESEMEVTRQKIATVRETLDQKLYSPVYQPIYDLSRQRVVGFESLTRFSAEPRRSPDLWFNEANEIGLGPELESAAIQHAMDILPHLGSGIYLSVNLSPCHILTGSIHNILKNAPLDHIILEVTEHEAIEDYSAFLDTITPLRKQGLRLAVDDAGAGFASFNHVLQLDPDLIKLDINLTRNIDQDAKRRALAAALISFAQESGIIVVAEGVETAAELETLKKLRVPKGQGYYLNRPLPMDQAMALL